MFKHLDDPTPPVPDDSVLEEVARRARRYRRRRRRRIARLTTTLSTVVLLGVLVVVGIGLGGSPSPHVSPVHPVESSFQFDQERSPLPAGDVVPTTSLAHVVFVDPEHGYALAEHGTDMLLAATADGGTHWRVVSDHLPGVADPLSEAEFDFTDLEHGYLWDGWFADGNTASTKLWVTDDGGTSWIETDPGDPVLDVEPIGTDVWALTSDCPNTAPTPGEICPVVLETSSDSGMHWNLLASPGVSAEPTTAAGRPDVELARITPASAYALGIPLSPGAGSSLPAWLAYTDDGGETWSDRPFPCAASYAFGAELAASATDDLWLLCGGQGAAGTQSKELFRSSDGGSTWTLAAATDLASDSPQLASGQLPLGGYIEPYSIVHQNVAVLSPTEAWLFPTRNGVYRTTDGGTTWTPVVSLGSDEFGDGSPEDVTFISATEGWVCEVGVGLARTTDGVHWTLLGQ